MIVCVTIRPIDATHTQTAEGVSKRALQAVAALAKAASTFPKMPYMHFNVRKKRFWNVMPFSGCMQTMHLLPGVAKQPNLELKTRPKPVLGSLPLAFVLPREDKSDAK